LIDVQMWPKALTSKKKDFYCTPPIPIAPKLKSSLKKLYGNSSSGTKTAPRGPYPPLADLCPAHGLRVPHILTRLVRALEARDLDADAIYKRPGDADEAETILRNFDKINLESVDAQTLAECIKTFLWQLEEPIIPLDRLDDFVNVLYLEDKESVLRRCLTDLPPANRDTMQFLLQHWNKVLAHSLHNGHTTASLATVFAPFVVGFVNERDSIDIIEMLLRSEWRID
ncbi:hypothetical protein PENTCL1PPCAC_5308, partial [Pristionchus entomophagus]